MLTTLLVCLLLAGCTPKDAKPTENAATPTLAPETRPSPEGTVAPEPADPESTAGSETEGLSANPESGGNEGVSASEPEEILATGEDGGLEVEEDYTVELGENVGVGGN